MLAFLDPSVPTLNYDIMKHGMSCNICLSNIRWNIANFIFKIVICIDYISTALIDTKVVQPGNAHKCFCDILEAHLKRLAQYSPFVCHQAKCLLDTDP